MSGQPEGEHPGENPSLILVIKKILLAMKSYTYIEAILPEAGTGVSLRRPTMWHRDEPVWLWGLPAMLALSGKPGSLLEPPHSGLPALWPHPCAVLSRSVMSNSCDPMDYSLPGSSVHGDSPGKNT